MAKRVVHRRRLQKVAVGDMREKIGLNERSIRPPAYGSADITEAYTLIANVWAKVDTLDYQSSGRREFDGVDVGESATHAFTIRYRDGVTAETVIDYGGELYKILRVTDLDERHQFLKLDAKVLGDNDKAANQ